MSLEVYLIKWGEGMKVCYIYMLGLLTCSGLVFAAPLIQSIVNKSDVDFAIVYHSDNSHCSLHSRGMMIPAGTQFKEDFLLERGKPSLVLRPVMYHDRITGQHIKLVDNQQNFDQKAIQKAFLLWKQHNKVYKIKNSELWLQCWLGGDIEVKPHTIEVFGYLMNLSRVRVQNSVKDHAIWLSFAKGVFSKLVLEVDIVQKRKKGIIPMVKVIPGEGGFCHNGNVQRL